MISATVSRGTKPRLTELVECKLEGLSGWASKTHGPKPQTKQTTYRLWQTSKTTTLKLGADRVLHSLSRFWVEGCGNKLEPTKAPSRQSYNIHISHHIIWSRRLIYSPYMSICICGLPTLVFCSLPITETCQATVVLWVKESEATGQFLHLGREAAVPPCESPRRRRARRVSDPEGVSFTPGGWKNRSGRGERSLREGLLFEHSSSERVSEVQFMEKRGRFWPIHLWHIAKAMMKRSFEVT